MCVPLDTHHIVHHTWWWQGVTQNSAQGVTQKGAACESGLHWYLLWCARWEAPFTSTLHSASCTLVDPFIQDASDLQLFPSASGRLSQRSPKPLHISEDRRIILPFWGFPCLPLSLGLVSFMIWFLIGKFVDFIGLSWKFNVVFMQFGGWS